MTSSETKHCLPCEGGVPPLDSHKIKNLLQPLPEWQLDNAEKIISREYKFKNFYKTMAFVNAIAFMAHRENHHPDLAIGYNYCRVSYTTHALQGLSENDFICATKVDALWHEAEK